MAVGAALAWKDDRCEVVIGPAGGTYMVSGIRSGKPKRQQVRTLTVDRPGRYFIARRAVIPIGRAGSPLRAAEG